MNEETVMGVAALVLGIISLVIAVFTGGALGWAGAIMGIIGIILHLEFDSAFDEVRAYRCTCSYHRE